MTRPAAQLALITASEALVERDLHHSIVKSDASRDALEGAKATLDGLIRRTRLVDIAALIHDATRHEQRFTHPTDALPAGHVVQLMGGRYAKILMHGFDSEGSFGYLCTAQFGSGDMLFTYHHRDTRSYAFAPMEPGR